MILQNFGKQVFTLQLHFRVKMPETRRTNTYQMLKSFKVKIAPHNDPKCSLSNTDKSFCNCTENNQIDNPIVAQV